MKNIFYKILLSFVLLLFVISCDDLSETTVTYSAEEVKASSMMANAFFDSAFDAAVDRSPMFQTYLGIKKDYGQWDDLSEEQAMRELAITKAELKFLKDTIVYEALDTQTKISYLLFEEDALHKISDFKFRHNDYPVNQMFGLHAQVPSFLINMHQITNHEDAVAYLSRLKKIEELFDQLISQLKIREDEGVAPPKFVYDYVIEDSQNIIKGLPFNGTLPSTLLRDFSEKVKSLNVSQLDKTKLVEKCNENLLTYVKPAYDKLISFLQDQKQRASEDDGIWKIEGGDAYYDTLLARTTTTTLTADQIHELGLREVDRIHTAMREIMRKVKFDGDLKAFFQFMKTDDQFFYPNTESGRKAYLDSAITIIGHMESRLDEMFITKPKAKLKVKRVEAFREKSAGTAFYQSAAPDGSRPGTYYANLYDMKNMAKYEMEALAYHEGLPGHHMDRSISQELTGIPKFRKFGGYTAYIEGWGLYCEYLPKEMGCYQNSYADYGRLAMELWRACRLVVDTGIHKKRWTRKQGIAYYLNNTSATERDCRRMVDRHIVMPSQATAYKIGMMKILELRQMSKEKLGDKFDIREFHEVILTNGALPLSVLEQMVQDWIKDVK